MILPVKCAGKTEPPLPPEFLIPYVYPVSPGQFLFPLDPSARIRIWIGVRGSEPESALKFARIHGDNGKIRLPARRLGIKGVRIVKKNA